MKEKILEFWKKYESKTVLILGFVLVAGLSFQIGILQGKRLEKSPLIIEKASQSSKIEPQGAQTSSSAKDTTPAQNVASAGNSTVPQNCAYVGSKNSNKYHLPTCRWAKQIKPENLVCFKTLEEALAKNYQPDKNCIK